MIEQSGPPVRPQRFWAPHRLASPRFSAETRQAPTAHGPAAAASVWEIQKSRLILEVLEMLRENSAEDWDGYGGRPTSVLAAAAAIETLRGLRPGIALPEPCPEPDGGMGLEWWDAKRRFVIVSFGPDGWMHFVVNTGERCHKGHSNPDRGLPAFVVGAVREMAPE